MKKVLVVAVHPDDETLGCGGTLLKHKAAGDEVHWLIVTEISEKDEASHTFKQNRQQEIEKVAQMYQFDGLHQLGFATTQVDQIPLSNLVTKISQVMQQVLPDTLYLPFLGDVHSDHRVIFDAVYSCTKSFRYPSLKTVCMMEILSETEFAPALCSHAFIPNLFVDISSFYEKKAAIMQIYEGELGTHPFPRSLKTLEALATLRGSTANCRFGEAFVLLKKIE